MKRKRGSAMILCLLLAIAATSAVLTITSLAANTAKEQTKREYYLKVRYSIEGVMAKVEQSFGDGSITLGVPTPITCGGIAWTVTTVDNSTSKAKSYQVTIAGTVEGNSSYSRKYVIGNPYAMSTFKFAVAQNTDLSLADTFLTGPAGKGDVFVDGTVLLGLFGTVDGDYYTTALIAPVGLVVKGKTVTSAKPLSFPTVDKTAYQTNANRVIAASPTTNWTFATLNELDYVSGNLDLHGVVAGQGTVFVDGSLTVSNDLTYLDSSSLIVFIVTGNAALTNKNINTAVGHYYVLGGLSIDTGKTKATMNGSVVGIGSLSIKSNLTLTFDPRIKNDQMLGYHLKLPGYWP